LLEDGKDEKATIRVEHVIRDDFTMEAYSIVELMCDLLHERIRHLSSHETCPSDLLECVTTLIWAADKIDISELVDVKKQLRRKLGTEFIKESESNLHQTVNPRVIDKLAVAPPKRDMVKSYLIEIAKEYNVAWYH
jgi:vacuolar protein sorting-associated protein IST1